MSSLERALSEVLTDEYAWVDSIEEEKLEHEFSNAFKKNMKTICKLQPPTYVHLGKRQLKKSIAVALIAALILLVSGCAFLAHHIMVTWNEEDNPKQGTLDISFDIDAKEGGTFKIVSPMVPSGFNVTSEDTTTDYSIIEYANDKGEIIIYSQEEFTESTALSLDNEENSLTEIVINGYKGYSYHKDSNYALVWTDGISFFTIQGTCNLAILEDMATSLQNY